MTTWPVFADECERFATDHLLRPTKLLEAFAGATGAGSGRLPGPRQLYWQTVAVFAYGALEAGLEDLVFAGHGLRNGCEGQTIQTGVNAPTPNPRAAIAEKRLQNPGPDQISSILFQDFGVLLGGLPAEARFEVRFKDWSLGGSGRGQPRPGPTNWADLRPFLFTLSYIRNATAHGDVAKLHAGSPASCEGALWLRLKSGAWSVQQPHALTALRTVLGTFNLVAVALGDQLGVNVRPRLSLPDTIVFPGD